MLQAHMLSSSLTLFNVLPATIEVWGFITGSQSVVGDSFLVNSKPLYCIALLLCSNDGQKSNTVFLFLICDYFYYHLKTTGLSSERLDSQIISVISFVYNYMIIYCEYILKYFAVQHLLHFQIVLVCVHVWKLQRD